MASRHSVQTGIREMLSSGVLQSLQSEGKRTEKMLRDRVFKGATRTARNSARSFRRFRSSVSRLLKTTSNQPVRAYPGTREDPSRRRRGLPEGLVGFLPVPKHRDTSVYELRSPGA